MSSYYRRRWYTPRRRYYSTNKAKQSIDASSPQWKSLQFIRTEFFQLDAITFDRFCSFYAGKYGSSAKQYMQKIYPRWKSGLTKMATQTERRILECVPPFLEKSKQFELLLFQVPTVVSLQRAALKQNSICVSELQVAYCRVANNIQACEYKLDWFVKEVFSAQELAEFLNVFKYTLLDCLRLSYARVRQDLKMVHEIPSDLDGTMEFHYRIAFFDCPLIIDTSLSFDADELKIDMPVSKLITDFHAQYKKLLLYHALEQSKLESQVSENQRIAISDIKAILQQVKRTTTEQEYDAKLEVTGSGGVLSIHLQKKNLSRLQYEAIKQGVALIATVITSVVVGAWLFDVGLGAIVVCLGLFLFGIIGSVVGKIQQITKEIKDYERKRTARLTPT